jgi:hypothetical protein
MKLLFTVLAQLIVVVSMAQLEPKTFKMKDDSILPAKALPRQTSEQPTIAGKSSGDITIQELLDANGIEVVPGHHISAFKMSTSGNGNLLVVYEAVGNTFDERMRATIKGLKKGYYIYIESIICRTEDDSRHRTKLISFRIK